MLRSNSRAAEAKSRSRSKTVPQGLEKAGGMGTNIVRKLLEISDLWVERSVDNPVLAKFRAALTEIYGDRLERDCFMNGDDQPGSGKANTWASLFPSHHQIDRFLYIFFEPQIKGMRGAPRPAHVFTTRLLRPASASKPQCRRDRDS
jgi:hypothetical protein